MELAENSHHLILNDIPAGPIKLPIEAIWPRSLLRRRGQNCILDLGFHERGIQTINLNCWQLNLSPVDGATSGLSSAHDLVEVLTDGVGLLVMLDRHMAIGPQRVDENFPLPGANLGIEEGSVRVASL